jgi:hypothetical protein
MENVEWGMPKGLAVCGKRGQAPRGTSFSTAPAPLGSEPVPFCHSLLESRKVAAPPVSHPLNGAAAGGRQPVGRDRTVRGSASSLVAGG